MRTVLWMVVFVGAAFLTGGCSSSDEAAPGGAGGAAGGGGPTVDAAGAGAIGGTGAQAGNGGTAGNDAAAGTGGTGGAGGVGGTGGAGTGGGGGTGGIGDGGVEGGEGDADAGGGGAGGMTVVGNRALTLTAPDKADAIDLLFMIDNSSSTADKQAILKDAIPQLVKRLVNPGCVTADGTYVSDWNGISCAAGAKRDFDPVTDIHIGIISSSLGAHGAGVCLPTETGKNNADMSHLLTRGVASPPAAGFLAWDGGKTMTEAQAVAAFTSMVGGVGEAGCGYEASLEAVYRFLSDPEPYLSITIDASQKAVLGGVDQTLLAQRAEFLRPDSLVAVISVSDEDDCSLYEGGQNWVVLAPPVGGLSLLKGGTQECAANPNDTCCRNCTQTADAGCPDAAADPICQQGFLTAARDPQNLRCFHQKQRYGYDFLYPVQRYIDAMTGKKVPDRAGTLVQNPLFSDLTTACTGDAGTCKPSRDPASVFWAAIVGVPWQDIAKDPTSLKAGLKTIAEIDWQKIVGDPANNVPPGDPLMIQSIGPRTGPGIAPPDAGPDANPINGHEWDPSQDAPPSADLQYACVFQVPDAGVCVPSNTACDCNGTPGTRFNPLCQNMTTGAYSNTQWRAKAYPGTRHLQALRGLGDQGVVASICPAVLAGDKNAADYGYNPAVDALVDRMRAKLRGPCLPVALRATGGKVSCALLEGFTPSGACTCANDARYPGRVTAPDSLVTPEMKALYGCVCQIAQLDGADLASCQNDAVIAAAANGWCYVDPAQAVGDASGPCAMVGSCAEGERRLIRFSATARPRPGATAFLNCPADVVSDPADAGAGACAK
jgi:hypothetical protein